jgi:ferric-dicitrate binding protein FerR (iron transport regulator)
MTRVSFLAEVATARPGDEIIYHTGLLMMDRMFGPEFQNVHAIATAAMEAWKEGRVHLVQKRVARGICAYIAIKRARTAHLRADQKLGSHYVMRNRGK